MGCCISWTGPSARGVGAPPGAGAPSSKYRGLDVGNNTDAAELSTTAVVFNALTLVVGLLTGGTTAFSL